MRQLWHLRQTSHQNIGYTGGTDCDLDSFVYIDRIEKKSVGYYCQNS